MKALNALLLMLSLALCEVHVLSFPFPNEELLTFGEKISTPHGDVYNIPWGIEKSCNAVNYYYILKAILNVFSDISRVASVEFEQVFHEKTSLQFDCVEFQKESSHLISNISRPVYGRRTIAFNRNLYLSPSSYPVDGTIPVNRAYANAIYRALNIMDPGGITNSDFRQWPNEALTESIIAHLIGKFGKAKVKTKREACGKKFMNRNIFSWTTTVPEIEQHAKSAFQDFKDAEPSLEFQQTSNNATADIVFLTHEKGADFWS
jgi:hypothetical protein